MQIKPLRSDLQKILDKNQQQQKFIKAKNLFEQNYQHPSLHTEKLEPKHLNLYSFRLDRKWRAIFIIINSLEVEIIDINPHYHD